MLRMPSIHSTFIWMCKWNNSSLLFAHSRSLCAVPWKPYCFLLFVCLFIYLVLLFLFSLLRRRCSKWKSQPFNQYIQILHPLTHTNANTEKRHKIKWLKATRKHIILNKCVCAYIYTHIRHGPTHRIDSRSRWTHQIYSETYQIVLGCQSIFGIESIAIASQARVKAERKLNVYMTWWWWWWRRQRRWLFICALAYIAKKSNSRKRSHWNWNIYVCT